MSEAMAVLRTGKISQSAETACHNHNLRASKTKQEANVDQASTHKNELLLGTRNTVRTISQKVRALNQPKKLRENINRAIELVMSASPEHFYDFEKAGITRDEWDELKPSNYTDRMPEYWDKVNRVKATLNVEALEKWKGAVKAWAQAEFGDNIVNLVLHMDEKTPHAHLIVVPVVDNRLSAKAFFTPANARKWQSSYAKATGLKRGVPSDRKHQELRQEYERGLEEGKAEGYKAGYEQGRKAGYAKYKAVGYARGKEQGEQASRAAGARVGCFMASIAGGWHQPTAKAVETWGEKLNQARRRQKRAEEEASKAKEQADKRVSTVATQLQTVKQQHDYAERENKQLRQEIEQLRTENERLSPSKPTAFNSAKKAPK